jgi:hypothetical protein
MASLNAFFPARLALFMRFAQLSTGFAILAKPVRAS